MDALVHVDTGLPTALGLCLEHVRQSGEFNMITEFSAAMRTTYALYTATTYRPVFWAGDPRDDDDHALTLAHFMAAYTLPKYAETVATLLRSGASLRNIIAAAETAHVLFVQHRQDTAATVRRSARLAKK